MMGWVMTQPSLFGPTEADPDPKPGSDAEVRLRVLVTVKAAPNPSSTYGETVCVAGIRAELDRPGWVRLYPINFRYLNQEETFTKYDLIEVDAVPARQDQRRESWRPRMQTLRKLDHLPPWKRRQAWLDSYIEDSMCRINRAAREHSDAPSLALVRPREVSALTLTPHPGWSKDEQAKIDAYVNQLDMLDMLGGQDRTPLEAPRFKASYRYRCHEPTCGGHDQGLLDWEFVALQRRLAHLSDEDLRQQLQDKFLTMMCDPKRNLAFYVGNQAKRARVFSVLGAYYPSR
jgi:hypothetical protein